MTGDNSFGSELGGSDTRAGKQARHQVKGKQDKKLYKKQLNRPINVYRFRVFILPSNKGHLP